MSFVDIFTICRPQWGRSFLLFLQKKVIVGNTLNGNVYDCFFERMADIFKGYVPVIHK